MLAAADMHKVIPVLRRQRPGPVSGRHSAAEHSAGKAWTEFGCNSSRISASIVLLIEKTVAVRGRMLRIEPLCLYLFQEDLRFLAGYRVMLFAADKDMAKADRGWHLVAILVNFIIGLKHARRKIRDYCSAFRNSVEALGQTQPNNVVLRVQAYGTRFAIENFFFNIFTDEAFEIGIAYVGENSFGDVRTESLYTILRKSEEDPFIDGYMAGSSFPVQETDADKDKNSGAAKVEKGVAQQ